jgi:hypothetical protein
MIRAWSGSRAKGAKEDPPNEKWGPALLPAPTAPSVRSAGVRDLDRLRSPVLRSWLTSSGVASNHDPNPRTGSGSSAALLGPILFSRFPSPREVQAAATERPTLPAPLASGSDELPYCLRPEGFQRRFRTPSPAGGDRSSSPWSSSVRLPFPPMARGRCPDHHCNMRLATSRAKRNLCGLACG